MNILLINPSLTREQVGHYNNTIEKTRGIYPSLGLLYIAAVLEQEGHHLEVIDIDIESNPQNKIKCSLWRLKPEILCIHVMTWTFHQANKIAKLAKNTLPSICVIAGGAAITSTPEPIMEYSVFDYGVIGEGEKTIVELIQALSSKSDISKIPGIIYRENRQIFLSGQRPLIETLDSIPNPARHLVKLNHYFDMLSSERACATMITSRGCPYSCIYCDRRNRMGNKWRSFSNRRIIDEMQELKDRYDIKEIMFFDDEFITDRRRTIEFCNLILEKNLKIIWECRSRVDAVDRELLKIMKMAGCYRIRLGFESGDDAILRILKKGITVSQSLECARMVKESGMEIFGYFMFGCPEETEKTIQKTIELIFHIEPDFAVCSKTILIPGSELFEWAVSQKLISADYWERFLTGEITNTAPSLSSKELPEQRINQIIKEINKKFYLRPKFMMRKLTKIKSISQLIKQAHMASSLLSH
ncbi:MAG: B12-binding domain-containing radical SAM protein [Candidatus Omnitrophica bacterium]|nr:B12-binding domain-containing radical SAM protein [Candidatus Omnitrophota bacterium]MBU1923116.1 B12-binding domain-containing radical SAM protein [Candidatus Omnitrophota bacterium]